MLNKLSYLQDYKTKALDYVTSGVQMIIYTDLKAVLLHISELHTITYHHMTVGDLQILSVFLVDMSGCYFHLTGSLGDIGSELYHLIREVERKEVNSEMYGWWLQQNPILG